jgi:MFS family permease
MASSFGDLLLARLLLGAITAAAGPVTASLTGDWFPAAERGKIYGYILTGELLGAGAGFAFTGDIAALSWRASFIILALPAFVLAWLVFRLPEPVRGGQGALAAEPRPPDGRAPRYRTAAPPPEPVQPQDIAAAMGIVPDQRAAAQAGRPMTILGTIRYILSVRTNVALIVSGACGYYFMAGIQTFGTEFVSGQYGISQVLSNLLLLVIGVGAVIGVIASGPISDMLLRRGHLTSRITVAAIAASLTVLLFIPALITHNALAALPYVVVAAAALSAQNPPIDAARLDIMPSWLWGRSEGVRTLLRTAAQSLAPLLFGAVADYIFGGGTSGLKWAFVVMLAPLTASALYLFRARRLYPKDVATAAEAEAQHALSTDVLSGQGEDHRDEGDQGDQHVEQVGVQATGLQALGDGHDPLEQPGRRAVQPAFHDLDHVRGVPQVRAAGRGPVARAARLRGAVSRGPVGHRAARHRGDLLDVGTRVQHARQHPARGVRVAERRVGVRALDSDRRRAPGRDPPHPDHPFPGQRERQEADRDEHQGNLDPQPRRRQGREPGEDRLHHPRRLQCPGRGAGRENRRQPGRDHPDLQRRHRGQGQRADREGEHPDPAR